MLVYFEGTSGYDKATIQLVDKKLLISVEANPTGGGDQCQDAFNVGLSKAPGYIATIIAEKLVKCHKKAWTPLNYALADELFSGSPSYKPHGKP